MKDNLARVLISGLIAGIVMDIFDYLLYSLKLSDLFHWDWASIVTYGHLPRSVGETVFGEMTNLFFAMLLAVLFAYVISRVVTNSNLFLRGLTFGTSVWFVVNVLAVMFDLPDLNITLGLAISNLITALIYGLTLAIFLQRLDKEKNS